MNGVHAARLAALELKEDLDHANNISHSNGIAIVLVLWMTYGSSILKTIVNVCKSMPSKCV